MKKTFALLFVGMAALGTITYMAGRSTADAKAGAPRTRVALVNLNYVIKNYEKYKAFQNELKKEGEVHQKEIQTKTAQMEAIKKKITPALPASEREKLESQFRNLKRDVEDITAKARGSLSRKGSEAMVTIYKEVRDTAQRYAASADFDLVFHFEEAATPAELDTPKNIMRKMNAGGCVPMYWKNGMDISWHVVTQLNKNFTGGK